MPLKNAIAAKVRAAATRVARRRGGVPGRRGIDRMFPRPAYRANQKYAAIRRTVPRQGRHNLRRLSGLARAMSRLRKDQSPRSRRPDVMPAMSMLSDKG